MGIDNAERRGRAREYLPYPDDSLDPPEPDPLGYLFDEFMLTEGVPLVESRFRVRKTSDGGVLGGSSYGALAALHVVLSRPGAFSGLLLEECATHGEAAWARRLPDALRFLFPPQDLGV